MILAVGNVKGGVGKTTLAINIAIAQSQSGRDVLLVDGDEQGTALAFTELRARSLGGSAGYTAVSLQGAALRTQIRQLAAKYRDIIVDVGGPGYREPARGADRGRSAARAGAAAEFRHMGARPGGGAGSGEPGDQ